MHRKPPPAEVVMADTAYNADHLRQAITAKEELAVIPNNRQMRSNTRSTIISMPSVVSWNAASQNSSYFTVLQPALNRRHTITVPPSLSPRPSYRYKRYLRHLWTMLRTCR